MHATILSQASALFLTEFTEFLTELVSLRHLSPHHSGKRPRKRQKSQMVLRKYFTRFFADLAAAIAFYTVIPVPQAWTLDFQRVARLAPLVGLIVGGLLSLLDFGLYQIGFPLLTRSALIVIAWIGLTGGLHLDGAIDTADGLAVPDPQRRLQVMTDSVTGAFGVMAALSIVFLKTAALADLEYFRGLSLALAAGWGRWGQQVAIARYPYLKPTGKGALHQAAFRSGWDLVPGALGLVGLSALPLMGWTDWEWPGLGVAVGVSLGTVVGGGAIAILTAAWFHHRLGGHTGDTYGAVVEWTEAFVLVLLTLVWGGGRI